MKWTYTIAAVSARRLLMRVVLIFDQQSLTLTDVAWRCSDTDGNVEARLRVRCDEALARRLHAKLLHLQDVLHVALAAEGNAPLAETVERA